MAAKALSGLFTMTSKGKLMTDDLRRAWTRMATSVAEQITNMLGPAIEDLTRWLDNLAASPFYSKLIAVGAAGVVGLSLLGAAISMIGFAAKTAGLIAMKFGIGKIGFGITEAILVATGGMGIKYALVAKLGALFAGIKGALVTAGVGGALSIAIPVAITLLAGAAIWKWGSMSKEQRQDILTKTAEAAAKFRDRWGISDREYTSAGRAESYREMMRGITGDINIDIYGNTFPYDMDEAALAAQLGYNIYDEYSNQDGAPTGPD